MKEDKKNLLEKKKKLLTIFMRKIFRLQASFETNSSEWEWDSYHSEHLFEDPCYVKDVDIDIVHLYGQTSEYKPLELELEYIDFDSIENDQELLARAFSKESNVLDLEIIIKDFNVSIMTLSTLDTQ